MKTPFYDSSAYLIFTNLFLLLLFSFFNRLVQIPDIDV